MQLLTITVNSSGSAAKCDCRLVPFIALNHCMQNKEANDITFLAGNYRNS